ncbi:MAG: DUF2914 domain-containing protein [Thermodesulfobacteriota bacterium]
MNQDEIENRDKELVQRFRAMIHYKTRHQGKNRRILLPALLVLCCAAIVFIAGYTGRKAPSPPAQNTIKNTRTVKIKHPTASAAENSGKTAKKASSSAEQSKTDEKQAQADGSAEPQAEADPASPPPKKSPQKSPAEKKATHADEAEPSSTGRADKSDAPEAVSEPGKQPEEAAQPETPAPRPRIASLVTCRGVENKQYALPKKSFSLAPDETQPDVWVWMDVRSEKNTLPYTLRHVYYVNGEHYADVSLSIRYPRMRTWSNVTLTQKSLTGQWRVDVVNADDHVLAQTRFTVAP